MNILITGCFHSLNSGVMAMAEGVIQNHPNDTIYIYSSPKFLTIDKERYSIYKNVNVIIPPWYKSGKLSNGFIALRGLLFGSISDKKFRLLLSTIDISYDISGDSITSDYGLVSSLLSLMPISVSNRYVKKSIIAPQSLGPFNSSILNFFVNSILGNCDEVYVRESITPYFIKSLGFKYTEVADLANTVEPKPIKEANLVDKSYIGVGVSALLSKFGKNDTEAYFKRIIDQVLESGYSVYLINHVSYESNGDLAVAKNLKDKYYRDNTKVLFFGENFRASEWKSIYLNSRGVISARMHPTVLALSAGIPALNLSYNHKSLGVVKLKYGPLGDVFRHDSSDFNSLRQKIINFLEFTRKAEVEDFDYLIKENKNSALEVFCRD